MNTAKTSTTAVAPVGVDNPDQAKAREALAHSLFEMDANTSTQPVTTYTPPPATATTTTPATTPATTAPVMSTPATTPAPTPAPAPAPVIVAKPMPSVSLPASPLAMPPPLPISEEKHQKLQELLTRYKADQITPEEYQKERAAILAGQ
jgi:hypothetical protein